MYERADQGRVEGRQRPARRVGGAGPNSGLTLHMAVAVPGSGFVPPGGALAGDHAQLEFDGPEAEAVWAALEALAPA